MKHFFLCTLLLCWAASPSIAVFGDEQQVFRLLMKTLRNTDDPAVQASLLKGMLKGLEGRRDLEPPESWGTLYEELQKSDEPLVRERASSLSQIFGDQAAVEMALATVMDSEKAAEQRRQALRSLLNQQNRQASDLLQKLLDDPEMVMDAIRGYAIVANESASDLLLSRYPSFDAQKRRAVIETLASRKTYAVALLQEMEKERIGRDEIPAQVARSLRDLLGDAFTKTYGEIREMAGERTELLAKYKSLCNPDAVAAASASRGRAVYEKTCAACHMLYGIGGKVGPDLTGSNRANLDYILLNSVDPSYDVPDAYRTVSVLTVDGRSVNGVLAEEDARRIVLKTPEQPRVVIAKQDIELRKLSAKSMMPEGQLDQMKPQEVLDLIKYLRTTQQVEMVK